MENKNIIELIAGYLTGQLDNTQVEELNCWIKADKGNKKYFEDLQELWFAISLSYRNKSYNKDTAYKLFISRISNSSKKDVPKESRVMYKWFVRVAAAVVTGFIAGAFLVYYSQKQPETYAQNDFYETIVPLGSRSQHVMTDGTKIWLNAGSKLRYKAGYGVSNREVYLEGEGFFDVARDTSKTFVVKTGKISIKALGTSFNVKAYPEEANIETILVSGQISIDDKVILEPNEKYVYSKKDEIVILEKKISNEKEPVDETKKDANIKIVETNIDPSIYTSWKDEKWRIESESLGGLALKLERRYDVKIRFDDKSSGNLNINATIKDESLEQVMRFLQLSVPIDFRVEGKTVVIKENKLLKEKYKDYYRENPAN
jgi:ferric-dicitrate binding protein FerR (iron transport regulator)